MAELIVISGVFTTPEGNPFPNVRIGITLRGNTNNSFRKLTATQTTDEFGGYSFELLPGEYDVAALYPNGKSEILGSILLLENSKSGTLNDYLVAFTPGPNLLKEMTEILLQMSVNSSEALMAANLASESKEGSKFYCDLAELKAGEASEYSVVAVDNADVSRTAATESKKARDDARIASDSAEAKADNDYTFKITESDPDGTIAGLAGTTSGETFRVGQGPGAGFKYFLNDNGSALEISSTLGEQEFTSRFYTDDNFYGVSSVIYDENNNAIGYTDDLGVTHMFNISLKDGYDISHDVDDIQYVSHVNEDNEGNALNWTCDLGIHHQASVLAGEAEDHILTSPISPQVYEHNEISEIGWNQWINNQAVKIGSDYLLSSVRLGSMRPQRILGNFAISRRQGERGRFGTYEFGPSLFAGGSASADDHDAPSILLDTRPNAERPLQIFNANHGTNASLLRHWSSPTFDPANIGAATQLSGHGGMTYAQTYRNPNNQDEIAVFSRYGNSNTARWFIYLSADNGGTWKANSFIGGDDLYMTSCQSLDGGSIHIAIQNHPRATDTRVLYLNMSWVDKSLKNYAGEVFAANIMTYQYTNLFASSIPDIVFTAATGNTKRLFEIKDVESSLLFLIAEFQPTDFSYRMMKLVKFESEALTTFDVGDCGRAIDNASYVAGGCIVSETDVLVCYWQNTPALGKLSRFKYDGASWVETIMDSRTDGNKICRPLIFKEFYQSGGILKSDDTNTIAYQRGNYVGYNLFDMNAVITKI